MGVQATHQTEQAAETAYYAVDYAMYGHKMKAYDKAEKLVKKSDKANVNAMFEKFKKDNPTASSNPLSRWQQKKALKKSMQPCEPVKVAMLLRLELVRAQKRDSEGRGRIEEPGAKAGEHGK